MHGASWQSELPPNRLRSRQPVSEHSHRPEFGRARSALGDLTKKIACAVLGSLGSKGNRRWFALFLPLLLPLPRQCSLSMPRRRTKRHGARSQVRAIRTANTDRSKHAWPAVRAAAFAIRTRVTKAQNSPNASLGPAAAPNGTIRAS